MLGQGQSSPRGGGGGDVSFVWNRTAVLLYLWNYYHPQWRHVSDGMESDPLQEKQKQTGASVSQLLVLQAAWPGQYRHERHKRFHAYIMQAGPDFTPVDTGICLVSYLICFLMLGLMGAWLYRKRRCRRFLH